MLDGVDLVPEPVAVVPEELDGVDLPTHASQQLSAYSVPTQSG